MTTTLAQLGAYLASRHNALNAAIADRALKTELSSAINDLKGGVADAGNTLGKLYALVINGIPQFDVADIAARDALTGVTLGAHVFVKDDGDGKWALYRASDNGEGGLAYVKLSDPDLLNTALTAAQIKAAYESNADTNAFTDAHLAKLTALPTAEQLASDLGAINTKIGDTGTLTTTATNLAGAINEVKAAAATALSDATAALKGDATVAGDTLGKLEDRIEALSTSAGEVAGDIADAVAAEATARDTAIAAAVTTLKGGVSADYDTLKKLQDKIVEAHDLAITAAQQISVADLTARDAVAIANETSVLIFVADDGDGRWALYRGMADAQGAKTYVKISDPDLLNAAMSAAAIKAAYESNADTNAYTDAEQAKLAALPTAAELEADFASVDDDLTAISNEIGSLASLTTTEKTTVVGAINEVKAAVATEASDRAAAITAAVSALKGDADASNDTLGKLADRIDGVASDLSNLSQSQISDGDVVLSVSGMGIGLKLDGPNGTVMTVDQSTGALTLGDGAIVLDPEGTLYSAVNANIGGTLYAGNSEHVLSNSGDVSLGGGILKIDAEDGTLLYNDAEVAKKSDVEAAVTGLLGGAPEAGNTLKKVYDLAVAAVDKIAVADIAARDALVLAPNTSKVVHVANDGDGKWAVYWAFADAEGDLSFEKISDPDQLNAVMSDAAIKAALLNNADTNVLTDAELAKLTALPTAAELESSLDTKADKADVGAVATLTTTSKVVVGAINEVKAEVEALGTFALFQAAFEGALTP